MGDLGQEYQESSKAQSFYRPDCPGGELILTELDGSAKTTASAQGLGDGEWGPWDISAIVPACIEVVVGIQKLTANDVVGVRKGGTSLIRTFLMEAPCTAFVPTLPSATRTIDIMSADVSDGDEFCIFGYRS